MPSSSFLLLFLLLLLLLVLLLLVLLKSTLICLRGVAGSQRSARGGPGPRLIAAPLLLRAIRETPRAALMQLRVACIHPQLTAYYRELSHELQLKAGRAKKGGRE